MSVKSACMCLIVFVSVRGVISEEIPKCQGSNNTEERCCPCFKETMISCNTTCPDGYLSINESTNNVICMASPSTTPSVTMTTPVNVTMETENTTSAVEKTTSVVSVVEDYVIICSKSCNEHQLYDNETMQCLKCNEKCLSCNWPDKNNCTVCRYEFNKTCYAKCPKDMVESRAKTDNGSRMCEMRKTETDDNTLYIIIGSSVGGAVVIIAFIIVLIVCCCCRRRRNKQSIPGNGERKAMSVILEQNKEPNKKTSGRPAGYENVSNTAPSTTEIQRQGDKVTRYTTDPTAKLEKANKNDEHSDEESPYSNMSMVKLAKKTDLTHAKEEKIKEMLELEDMGDAPRAPTPLPVSTNNQRKGIVKSLSQRVSKKLGRKKGKSVAGPAHAADDVRESYVDMTGSPKGSVPTTDPNTTGGNADPGAGLEDYVNINFSQIPQGRKAAKSTGQETSQEDGMELYENSPGVQSAEVKGDNSDMEDYENTKELSKKPKGKQKPKGDDDKDLEDYENMKDMDLELYENTHFQK